MQMLSHVAARKRVFVLPEPLVAARVGTTWGTVERARATRLLEYAISDAHMRPWGSLTAAGAEQLLERRGFHEVMLQAARTWWPGEPAREQIRRIGQIAFPTIERSLVGKVMFGALSGDVGQMLRLAPKGWSLSLSEAQVECIELRESHGVLRFAGIYSWLDCYEPGVLEGGLMAVGRSGVVAMKTRSLSEADLYIAWR